jgi:predicted nuclease of restriction endonuclease-like (RecB) superfamily
MPNPPLTSDRQYTSLLSRIGERYQAGRTAAVTAINRELLMAYWEIGHYIVGFEQRGKQKAAYGKQLLKQLSHDLQAIHGSGFSHSNLVYMRLLFLKYPKSETLSHFLGWSHYFELLKLKNSHERSFYEQQCINERWSVRELKRQKETSLYHRLAASKSKEEILEMAKKGRHVARPEDLLREPYIFEFLQLPVNHGLRETELEQRLADHLQAFMLELGRGFAFVGRQKRITVGNDHHYVDLVFYHYILKCFVLIDLKVRKANPGDIGQMNMYLNYFRNEENQEDDNPPVGIVLATHRNEGVIQYALEGIGNQLLVSKYETFLPKKELLRAEIERVLAEEE